MPEEVAGKGPLHLELETIGGHHPPGHLPAELGVGIDWIEVEPFSEGVRLQVSFAQLAVVLLGPLLAFGFVRWTGGSFRQSLLVMVACLAAVALFTAWTPFPTWMAIKRLWVVFPIGFGLERLLAALSRLPENERYFLVRTFVAATLAHSILIFFPNHAPPDLWNHLPQVEWLSTLEASLDEVYRFASSSDPFDDGHVRPHFGVDYGAPYPPFFYLATFAASLLHGDTRFLIEFLSVVVGALIDGARLSHRACHLVGHPRRAAGGASCRARDLDLASRPPGARPGKPR